MDSKKEIISLLFCRVDKIRLPMFLLDNPMGLHLGLTFEIYSGIFTINLFFFLIL